LATDVNRTGCFLILTDERRPGTTVAAPLGELAIEAVGKLRAALGDAEGGSSHQTLPVELVTRASTAEPGGVS
jgi:DNA-binding LacI/PurR family transcriptional regulator